MKKFDEFGRINEDKITKDEVKNIFVVSGEYDDEYGEFLDPYLEIKTRSGKTYSIKISPRYDDFE
jgi:hypothetical protein